MLDQMQAKLEEAYKREKLKREDLILIIDKKQKEKEKPNINEINKLKEKQRKRLSKFLNKYKENDILMVKCKESFQIEDLFFKKNNYYLLTFAGILETYEEVPFIIHDLKILNNSEKEFKVLSKHDTFTMKSKHLFQFLKFINSIGKTEYRYDQEYKYFYFNHILIMNNMDIRQKFNYQSSIYEKQTYEIIYFTM